jgi:hypothetical protein
MILSGTGLTQGCDSNHEGKEAKQQGWKSHAARLLVNSNTELFFVLHLPLQLDPSGLPFSQQAYRVFRTPASTLDVRAIWP